MRTTRETSHRRAVNGTRWMPYCTDRDMRGRMLHVLSPDSMTMDRDGTVWLRLSTRGGGTGGSGRGSPMPATACG